MNLNSILIAALTIVTGVAGWGINHTVSRIEETQKQMQQDMMPRQEIQVRLETIQADYVDLRARVALLETTVARQERNKP